LIWLILYWFGLPAHDCPLGMYPPDILQALGGTPPFLAANEASVASAKTIVATAPASTHLAKSFMTMAGLPIIAQKVAHSERP
jgi:hypothetical protein